MSTYRDFIRSDRKDSISQNMLYNYRHQSGMHICFVVKPGFVRKFAAFGIPYGSAHLKFTCEEDFARYREARKTGEALDIKVYEVPPGSAHYLEHCLFSQDAEGGLLGQMASLGAQANAFTSDSETVYYFSTVDHFNESLDLYFSMLMQADISDERVEAEREIIAAEIDMYEDDPDSVGMKLVLSQLYSEHGLKHDIAGTKESIAQINHETLAPIVKHFYTPAAMSLVIVGDFPEEEMREVIDYFADRLDTMDIPPRGVTLYADEPATVAKANGELVMDIENERFHLGFKNPNVNRHHPTNGSHWALIQAQGQLFCNSIIGDASPLYQELYEAGIINDSFGIHFACGHDYNYIFMGGEAEEPQVAAGEVLRRFQAAVAAGAIDKDVFNVQKKALHGDFVRSLDHIEASGMAALEARLFDNDLFDHAAIFSRLDADTANHFMKFVLDEGSVTKLIMRKRGF